MKKSLVHARSFRLLAFGFVLVNVLAMLPPPSKVYALPTVITTCQQLQDIDNDLAGDYELGADIDCIATVGWNGGDGFSPIGMAPNANFTGTFNGKGREITNLTINRGANSDIGLFRTLDGATVKNLSLSDSTIRASQGVGSIAGETVGTALIQNVSSSAEVFSTYDDTGGLVGHLSGTDLDHRAEITGSSFSGIVHQNSSADPYTTAGLVGSSNYAKITSSFTDGEVRFTAEDPRYIGGLVGQAGNTEIVDCYSTSDIIVDGAVGSGTLTSASLAGGLVGDLVDGSSISRSYATGTIDAQDYHGSNVGGLVGNLNDSSIDNSYAVMTIYARASVGGLVGNISSDGGTINRSYAASTINSGTETLNPAGGLVATSANLNAGKTVAISNSFAVPSLTGDTLANSAAFVGVFDNQIDFANNFYDAGGVDDLDCGNGPYDGSDNPPYPSGNGCRAVNTAAAPAAGYFKGNRSRGPLAAWDFVNIWKPNTNGYPTFRPNWVADDDDGASMATENAAPNGGDANNDGVQDGQQATVTSLVSPVNGKYAALETSGCDSNSGLTVAAEDAAHPDSVYGYPAGLMSFTVKCNVGGTATITQYFYGLDAAKLVARKYNSTTHEYTTIPGAVLSSVTIAGQQVAKLVYQVTDGGALDQDGTANGVIVDPAGVAASAVGAPNTGLERQSRVLSAFYLVSSLIVLAAALRRPAIRR